MKNASFVIFFINILIVGAAALAALVGVVLAALQDLTLGFVALFVIVAGIGLLALLFLQARIN